MTVAEAVSVSVRPGAKVTSPHTVPARRPLRVTDAWTNAAGTIVRFRIHSLGDAWVDSSGVDLPPAGCVWNEWAGEWQAKAAA